MKQIKIRVKTTHQMLGSASSDPKIHERFIASKAKTKDETDQEVESVPENEKGRTVFHRGDNGEPIIYDYMVKGFFKEACKALRIVKGMKSNGLTAYKSKIDNNIFVQPRKIPIKLAEGDEIKFFERSLRADTPQGPRVALASSECIEEGAILEFTVLILEQEKGPKFSDCVTEWLNYGQFKGFGQWRSSGRGSFTFEVVE